MSKGVLPMFSFRSFIVSGLTFRSLIHFEFTFVYGVRECSDFILLHVAVQFSQHHLLKRLSFFSIVYSCLLCHRLIDHKCMGLFLSSIFFFFFFGCVGSLLLRGLSLVAVTGGYSWLQCTGFLLQWLLLLRSTGSRRAGFSSCGTQAQ